MQANLSSPVMGELQVQGTEGEWFQGSSHVLATACYTVHLCSPELANVAT